MITHALLKPSDRINMHYSDTCFKFHEILWLRGYLDMFDMAPDGQVDMIKTVSLCL